MFEFYGKNEGDPTLPLLSRSSQVGARPKWTSRGSLPDPFSVNKLLRNSPAGRTHLLRNHASIVLVENIIAELGENIFTGGQFYESGKYEKWS